MAIDPFDVALRVQTYIGDDRRQEAPRVALDPVRGQTRASQIGDALDPLTCEDLDAAHV